VAENDKNPSALRRVSLAQALPLVSMLLALTMALIFLAVSMVSVEIASRKDSGAEAQRLARIISDDLAHARMDQVSRLIHAYDPHDITVSTPDGTVVASTRGPSGKPVFETVEITHNGRTIGTLETSRLVPAGLSIPDWGISLLVLMACGLAAGSGHFFAARMVRSVREIIAVADTLRRGDAKADNLKPGADFTELREMHVSIRRAVSSVQRDADELRQEAFSNPVSGLPNFTSFMRALSDTAQGADFDRPAAVFCLDLDHFDRACESFGSGVGDVLLSKAIERIEDELAAMGPAGGFGAGDALLAHPWGDSLYLVVRHIQDRAGASVIARALRGAFVAPIEACGYEISLGLSGGIVMIPEDGQTPNDLVRRAETALRNVRKEMKGGFQFYAPRLDRVAKGRAQLEAEIREAIDCGEFVPHFQPKLDLRTGRVRGCEALARWMRPDGHMVSPGAFIPVAEETGLIDDIGKHILRESCRAAVSWLQEGFRFNVAVNVSPTQLRDRNFRDTVLNALAETGLPPSHLELEITESVAIEDPSAFQDITDPLRAMGVRLALDDFGTGHSNLAILSRLNFDVFKIDRQFIQNLEGDASARPIIEMILAMAESLGLETVAEGVETQAHARFLRQRGCTAAQGFFYSRALPAGEFLDFARDWEERRQRTRLARAS